MRLGVLDVGSNTAHFLVVDAYHGAAPLPAHSAKIELRLAEHTDAEERIERAAVESLIDFVTRSLAQAEDLGVTDVVGFATSAIRQARNGDDVIARVEARTGVRLLVLSGEDEARLTFLAVRRWFGWSSGRLLVLDIGGGSLEIAVGEGEEPAVSVSLPLGAGRLTRGRFHADPPSPDEVKALRREVRAVIADVAGRITALGAPRAAVGTSKTFRQLGRITGAAPSAEGPYVQRDLTAADLKLWLPKLARMTSTERARLPGVSEGRAPQLVAGAVVADAAMDLLGVATLAIAPWALREGVILRRLDAMRDPNGPALQ